MVNNLYFAVSLFLAMVTSFLDLQLQYTIAASIEVPKYEVDELNPENGPVVRGTQFIETAAANHKELLKSMDVDGMDTCIEMNGEYARVYGIPN
jgi:hypothetical protein